MPLSDWLLAYALSQGSHTGGHFKEAAAQEVGLRFIPKELSEQLDDDVPKRETTNVMGGGFQNQDFMSRLTENEDIQKKEHLINALMKGAYLFNAPKYLGAVNGGDIENMERTSGNKYIKPLLAVTAIADVLKGTGFIPKKYGNLSFSTLGQGTPGVVWQKQW